MQTPEAIQKCLAEAGQRDHSKGTEEVKKDRAADPPLDAAGRSLAYHRAVADRLARAHADDALYRLRKWRSQGKLDPVYADAWEKVLGGSLDEIRAVLTEDSQSAADLRQNSPFAGVLSEPERRALIGALAP